MVVRWVALVIVSSLAWGQELEQAKRAFDRGDYETAARLFAKIHEIDPSCDILFYLGLARYRLNQGDAALIAFRGAVECNPKLTDAQLALAAIYAERHNDTEALVAFTRVLSIEPRNSAALSGAATIYLKNHANEKAIELLESLTKVDAKDPDAHADLAAAYAAAGDRDRATQQFENALQLDRANASALMGLGNLCLKNGEEERAIGLLQKAVAAAPKAFEPRFLLGSAYNRLARYQEALVELEAALRLGADESEVYYHLARAYGGLGRADDRAKALAQFAAMTRKQKEDVESQRRALRLMEEGGALVDAGNLPAAAARLEEARALRPADNKLLFRLASVNYDLKRYELAGTYAQEAIALAPSEWLTHYLAGLIAKASGKWPQARSSFETSARLNPSAAEVQNAIGEVALHEGDHPRAIAYFRRATELNPAEPAYRLNLEAVLKQ